MKKLFIILFVLVVVILMVGCLNLGGIFPFLNQAPVIISEPIITAIEDQLYLYQVEASDPNGDTLIYSFTIKPEGMDINSESGLISWTPTNDQVGMRQIIVEISDGKQSITQRFEIEVLNVNNPPQIFSYSPANLNFKINEGSSVKFEVQAHDIDLNTSLNYQWLLNEKKVSSFTISGDGSKSSWIYSTGYGDYSQKIVKFLVTDGELEDWVQWNITINDITPPAQPTLNTVTSPTNIPTQTLFGNKESNTSIWINGVEVISVNSVTTWSYSYNLSEGENNISITSKDSAGNESSGANAKIILDSILPTTPTLNEVITPTNVSIQVLFGTKETNSSIWLNGVEVISLNSYTDWSYSYNLSEGTNNISIASRDMVGNESSAITSTIEYDPDIYVDAANTTGIEDGTKTHPFNTIAEGIDAVAPGKSVMVAEGTYNEQLIINKEGITLQGADKENTFINGASVNGNLIILEADCITITGFTIDGDGSASIGIYFNNYSSININNNIIQNNSNYGINYSNSSPTIENNNIKNNNYSGIDVGTGGAGIIRNNFAVSNKYGIHTYGDSSPEITGNNIINNNTGIYCRESATPIISYNTIGNNDYCGILIHNLSGNLVNPDIGNEHPSQGQSAGRNKITGNNNYGIYNKTNHRINAENNWWGDTNGPIWSGNTTTTGDRVYCDVAGGIINFFPWLSVAP